MSVTAHHNAAVLLCSLASTEEAVGGFPDYHLFARQGNGFRPVSDLFYKVEDQYCNELPASLFPGVRLAEEAVQYVCHPGDAFDRQHEKFRLPFGAYPENLSPGDRPRLRLCDLPFESQLAAPRARGVGQTA